MPGLDDIAGNAAEGGIQEKVSDTGIEKAGDLIDDKTGGGHTEQIDKVEQIADQKIGQ